jgi:hypothetical protein
MKYEMPPNLVEILEHTMRPEDLAGADLYEVFQDRIDELLASKKLYPRIVCVCNSCGAMLSADDHVSEDGLEEYLCNLDCACYFEHEFVRPGRTDDEGYDDEDAYDEALFAELEVPA